MDPLQRLHTLQNLALLLGPAGDGVPSIPRTLRDANLQVSRPGCAAVPRAAWAAVKRAGWWISAAQFGGSAARVMARNALHGPHSIVCSDV